MEKLLADPNYYGVTVERLPSGATVIDIGLESKGGYEAGLMTTRVAMGGAGTASLGYARANVIHHAVVRKAEFGSPRFSNLFLFT